MSKKIVLSSLRDQVFEAVQEAIITNELPAGLDIQVDKLATRYGVSATPVREAMALLEGAGLVKVSPNKGFQIAAVSLEDVRDVWEIRRLMEPYAAEAAASRCTEEELNRVVENLERIKRSPSDFDAYMASDFATHELVLAHGVNHLFEETLRRIWRFSARIRYFAERSETARADVVLQVTEEHLAIVRALQKRDGHLASHLMLHHLIGGENRTLGAVSTRINSAEQVPSL